MKAILINSKEKTIKEVEILIEENFNEAYEMIGCDIVEQVTHIYENGDTLLIDEEGRLKDITSGFMISTETRKWMEIFGNALIVNFSYSDGEGDSEYSSAKTDISILRDKIRFICF